MGILLVAFTSCNDPELNAELSEDDYLKENFLGTWQLDSSSYTFNDINNTGNRTYWINTEYQRYNGLYLADYYHYLNKHRDLYPSGYGEWVIETDSTQYDSVPFSFSLNFLENGAIEVLENYNGIEKNTISRDYWTYSVLSTNTGLSNNKDIVVSFSLLFESSLKYLSQPYNSEFPEQFKLFKSKELENKSFSIEKHYDYYNAYFYFSKK